MADSIFENVFEFAEKQQSEKRMKAAAEWNLLGISELSEPLPPVPWLCEGLGLAPGAATLVAGYGYSRKTMAMQSLGLSVALGKAAWGVHAVRKGRVVHLDYEQGRRLTQERYQRLARGMGFDLRDLPEGSLQVASMPRVYLQTQEAIDALLPIVDGAAFVLIDSLRAAFPKADENSSDVRSYLDALNHLSERTGAANTVIHHARKPSAQQGGTATHAIRGSSALFDACQSVYVFEGEKDTPTRVHHQKDRIRGATCDLFGLTSVDIPGPGGEREGLLVKHLEAEQLERWEATAEERKSDGVFVKVSRLVREQMVKSGGRFAGGVNLLRELCGVKKDALNLTLAKMIANGELRREGTYHHPEYILVSQ